MWRFHKNQCPQTLIANYERIASSKFDRRLTKTIYSKARNGYMLMDFTRKTCSGKYDFKIITSSPRDQWVKHMFMGAYSEHMIQEFQGHMSLVRTCSSPNRPNIILFHRLVHGTSHLMTLGDTTTPVPPLNTWRNNNVVITSKRRHFDVITSKWRRFDVITK